MNDQERAEEHLRTIRRLMERATIYRAISAPTALIGGLLSIAASYATWIYSTAPDSPGGNQRDFFFWIWLPVLLLTGGANTMFIMLGARRRNERVFSPSMRAAFAALAPAMILGAAVSACFLGTGNDPGLHFFLAIVWAACYGLGLLATGHFAPRSLILLGWAFLLAGIAGMVYLRFGEVTLADAFGYGRIFPGVLFLGATFGLFHLIYAACAWPRNGASMEL